MMVVFLPAVCGSRPIYPVLRARCHAVETGQYASTSEAIREAVREWQERRDLPGYTVDELRVLVQEGIDSGPATPFDPESIDHEGRRLLKARHD